MIINGVNFHDFGTNNYSCGMSLVTSTDSSITVEKVLKGEYPGIYLNPSAPCYVFGGEMAEFFGVYGTEEQYAEFYQKQREALISKKLIEGNFLNAPLPIYREAKERISNEYKDWWLK